MKIRIGELALSASLLISAGNVQAAVTLPDGTGNGVPGPGELVFVALNNDNLNTFVADLGLSFSDLVGSGLTNKTWNFGSDAAFSAAYSAFGQSTTGLTFVIASGYTRVAAGNNPSAPAVNPWGVVAASSSATPNWVPSLNNLNNASGSDVPQVVLNSVNPFIAAGGKSANVTPDPVNGSLYDRNLVGNYGGPTFGALDPNASWILNTDPTTGTATGDLLWLTQTGLTNQTPGSIKDLGALSFNATTGLLSLTVTPSAVPVPPALWLLGSALLGFAGIARRDDKAKA
jgi:hypothetical protein